MNLLNNIIGNFITYLYKILPQVPVTTTWRVPWVADGGVGLQIWSLAANILNKQSLTGD